MPTEPLAPAGFWRRLAAMSYDGLLILALWIITTFPIVVLLGDGKAVTGPAFQLFLYLEAGAFYTCFWRIKGQTLGMQVWKVRTINDAGQILSCGECAVRYFLATVSLLLMGLGFLWMLLDPEKLAWHDRASGTRVIYLGNNADGL